MRRAARSQRHSRQFNRLMTAEGGANDLLPDGDGDRDDRRLIHLLHGSPTHKWMPNLPRGEVQRERGGLQLL